MSTLNNKTYVLIDYVNNLYAFVNGTSDIINFYNSLGGTITGCSSNSNIVTCDSTSLLIPNLTLIKTDGGGTLITGTKVYTVTDSTHFTTNTVPLVRLSGGITNTIKITNPGGGYTFPPSVSFSAPNILPGITPSATTTISSGYVSTVTVVNPGTNYTAVPTVTFQDPFVGSVWTSTGVAVLGDNYYYTISGIKVWYECTQAGVFGTTAPSHISGVATNGTAKLTYVGNTATGQAFFKGATLKAFMDITTLPRDTDGYLIDIFLVNINTKEEVKIKFTNGSTLCI